MMTYNLIIGFVVCVLPCNAQTDSTNMTTLNKEPIQLKEVVVKSQSIISKADKFIKIISINENKNGEELLRQTPSIALNGKDITINGSSGAKVFINDREIRLSGDNLISYIRSLSSKDIESIEVFPVAGASYDADARGGIIKIKLRHKHTDDYQGSIAVKGMASDKSFAMRPSYSYNMHQHKLDFYTFGSGSWTTSDRGSILGTRYYRDNINHYSSFGDVNTPANNQNISAGMFYEIDSLRTIGAELGYFHDYTDMNTNSCSYLTYNNDIQNSNAQYSQRMKFNMLSGSLNYQRKFDNNGSMFKIMVDYVKKKSVNHNLYNLMLLWNNRDSTYRSNLSSTYNIASTDVSYKKVLTGGTALLTGIKFTTTQMINDNSYQSFVDNQWKDILDYNYSSRYNEHIFAAYAEINTEIKQWQIIAGLRAENTKTTNKNVNMKKDYSNIYPHVILGYSFDEMKRWMISMRYARQIERPAFDALNPNRIELSQYSYQIGNPDLKPSYINRISATLIHDYKYTLTLGCDLYTDLIREFAKQDPKDKNVSYVTYENHNRENHWFININAPFQFGNFIDLNTNLTVVRQCIQMTANDNYSNHNLVFFNCVATMHLPYKYDAEIEYDMHNRLYSGNSSIKSSNSINFKLKKTFAKDKILLTAGIDNILNESARYQSELSEYSIKSRNLMGSTGRLISLSLTYNFNKGSKIISRRVENSSSEDRARMSKKL